MLVPLAFRHAFVHCSYSWEFNGKPFDPAGTDNRVVNSVGLGTLVFASPESQFSGFYKCFARNDFGLAVSDTVQIINASKPLYNLSFIMCMIYVYHSALYTAFNDQGTDVGLFIICLR